MWHTWPHKKQVPICSVELSWAKIVELEDNRKSGIATLGWLKQHPCIAALRRFIERWHLSYFTPDAARTLTLSGAQKHLNIHGDNLGNVVQYLEREHSRKFKSVLKSIAEKIPGINKIDTEKSADGRLLLRFNKKGFTDLSMPSRCLTAPFSKRLMK